MSLSLDFQVNMEDAIDRYGGMVRRLAQLNTTSMQDAEDIFQEVFLKLYNNRTHIESEEHLKAWLIRVAINECHSQSRAAYKRYEIPVEDIDLLERTQETFETDIEDDEIYKKVKGLPKKYREVVLLYYYENLSIKEIAELLDMNENSVKTRLVRARFRLAALLSAVVVLLAAIVWTGIYLRGVLKPDNQDVTPVEYNAENLGEDIRVLIPEKSEDEYIVVLPDGSEMVIDRAVMTVWECIDEESGSYVCKLNSTDVEKTTMQSADLMNGRSVIRAEAPSRQFILTDSAGHESECTAIEMERGDNYAIYEITLYIEDVTANNLITDWVKIEVMTDSEFENAEIIEARLDNTIGTGEAENVYDTSDEYEFREGTYIHPFAFMRAIAYDENDDILPFDEWEGMSSAYDGFVFSGEIDIKTAPIENNNDIRYVFSIHDKEGNSYWTDISE